MRLLNLAIAAGMVAVATLPALAMDNNMMSKGEGVMIMSDGSMATMTTMDAKGSAMMMKHPMKGCVIMMMGSDGKMYMTTGTDKACTAMKGGT